MFRRRHFFQGRDIVGAGVKDISWLAPTGREMTEREWQQSFARCLGLFLAGNAMEEQDERGRPIKDDTTHHAAERSSRTHRVSAPAQPQRARWQVLLDTSFADGKRSDGRFFYSNEKYPLQARSWWC